MVEACHKDAVVLPDGWEWTCEWEIDPEEAGDSEGWAYTKDQGDPIYTVSLKKGFTFKRRMWKRSRARNGAPVIPKIQELVQSTGGWEYGRTFGSMFDIEELPTDMVRRRRWVRYITNMDPCECANN